ncbi:hypothetical protein KAT55_01105 [Candidatus Bathyarchaeota archaeon]|nr:hypothetical protein [Candidatus Bathyarchaeota archaeon]
MRPSYILPFLLVSILIPMLNQSTEPDILLQLHSFNVTQSGPEVQVCGEVWLESSTPEMEYCSLDLIVDGMIVGAVCWSDLPDVPWAHPAVNAPTVLYMNRTITLREGVHELQLESYARNTEHEWARYTSPTVTLARGRGDGSLQDICFTKVKTGEAGSSRTVSASINYTSPLGAVKLSYGLLVDGEAAEMCSWRTTSSGHDTCLTVHKRYALNASDPPDRVQLYAAVKDRYNNTVLRISRPIPFTGTSDAAEEQGTSEAPGGNVTLLQVTAAGRSGNSTTLVLERLVGVDPGPTPWLQAPVGKVKLTVMVQPDGVSGLATMPEPGVYLADEGSVVCLLATSGSDDWVFREWTVSRAGEGVTRVRGEDGCVEVELTCDTVVTALHSQIVR